MRLAAWFQPPRQVLTIFLAVAVVSAVALGGLTWQLMEQDRDLEAQRRQVKLDQAADALVATMQKALADLQSHVGVGSSPGQLLPPDVVAISITGDGVTSFPVGRLLYQPAPPTREVSPSVFEDGERVEFAGDTAAALQVYTRLASTSEPNVRGGALMRLARVYRARGAHDQALRTYDTLEELDGVAIEQLPAGLIARLGRIGVFEQTGRTKELGHEATRLLADLLAGRWPVTRVQYDTYAREARARLTNPPGDDPNAVARAEAAAWLWEHRGVDGPLTRSILMQPIGVALVVWKSTPARLDGLIAGRTYLTSIAGEPSDRAGTWALSNFDGRPILGDASSAGPTGPPAVRLAETSGLPWTVKVFAPAGQELLSPRRPLLLLVLSLVTVVLAAGWYFIFRSLSRERTVARLQSDFVAAVSHEFRSPLTALSHAAELLVHDRLPSEALRRQTYDVLMRDTARLRSLVEGLLEFGRLEAGATAFRFEHLNVGALVESTVTEFQDRVAADGYTVERTGHATDVHASVDREALSRALWNLLDNAVKYSPESRTVEVALACGEGRVSIVVRDHGLGIPTDEQSTIFDRFVRGAESKSRRIHGTGIGLAMVRQIAQAHGGQVSLESEVGAGSAFTIQLPAGPQRRTEAATSPEPASRAQASDGRSRGWGPATKQNQ